MESFILLKGYMKSIGLAKLGPNFGEWIYSIFSNCIFFLIFATHSGATFSFFVFKAEVFREYAESFFYFSYALLELSWYTLNFLHRDKHADIFMRLDAMIAKRSKSPISKSVYQVTTENVEKLSKKVYFILMVMVASLFVGSANLMAIYKYIASNYSTDTFKQQMPAAYPFDWKKPIGYTACMIIQSINVFATIYLFICTLTLNMGICVYAGDFVLDIEKSLHHLNDSFSQATSHHFPNQVKVKKIFVDNIRFHSDTKEFINGFSNIGRGVVFSYILYAVVSNCSTFLQTNALLATGNFSLILQALLPPVMLSLSSLYLFCHYGDHLTHRFEDVGAAFYEFKWYKLPLDLQKNLPFVIAGAQKKVFLRGYAGTACTREIFKRIMTTTFNYFMVLRRFDS